MKKHTALLIILCMLRTQMVWAVGKVQQQDIKTLSQCTTAGATGATCLPLDSQVWDSTNAQQLSVSIANGQLGGAGGTKNYLTSYLASSGGGTVNTGNGDFEHGSTTGWSLAHSALTGTTPTSTATAGTAFSASAGGSAASANLSLTATTTTPIQKKYSGSLVSSAASTAGDMMISSAFYIDTADQAKMMTIKAYYSAISGAANLNFSGTSSNSYAVWVYDVTNGAWIMPAGVYNLVQGTGVGYATATFQTTSNSTQYQLALININASGGAFTLYFDDLSIGPQTAPQGPAMTDSASYSLTIGAVTTAPSQGSGATNAATWKREGDVAEITFTYAQTNAGTAGSGAYLFPLPAGLVIDTTKVSLSTNASSAGGTTVGTGFYANTTAQSTTNAVPLTVVPYNTTNLALYGCPGTVNETFAVGSGFGALNGNPIYYAFKARVPIVGWSSNTSASNDTDTRTVQATSNLITSSQSIGTSATQVQFNNVVSDSHGAFTTSGYVYTAPVSGKYSFSTSLTWSATSSVTAFTVFLYKNGSAVATQEGIGSASVNFGGTFSFDFQAVAGDTFSIYAQMTGASANLLSSASITGGSRWDIRRLSGPAVVAATESVNARYYSSSTSLSGSLATVNYATKDFDSHAAYSGGTWTAPVSGKVAVNCALAVSGTFSLNSQTDIQIQKNGTAVSEDLQYAGGSETAVYVNVSDVIAVAAGDTVRCQASSGASGPAIVSSNSKNYISIARVGN